MKPKNKKAVLILVFVLVALLATLCGCRKSDIVAYNVSRNADNFDVRRRITVLNARTDTIMFTLEGTFSIANNLENELEIICKTGSDEYKKHFVYLNEYTCYVVEDLSGADVNEYKYEVNFYPRQLIGPSVDIEIETD